MEDNIEEHYSISVEHDDAKQWKMFECLYCGKSKKNMTSTVQKAHLSNRDYSRKNKVALCTEVPANVSIEYVKYFESKKEITDSKQAGRKRVVDELNHVAVEMVSPI